MLTMPMANPLYTGGGSSSDIVGVWDVALNGRPYMIDTRVSVYTGHSEFMHASVPLIRNQADSSSSPSEASINPNDLWRRSQDTWHLGAGQSFLDRADSDPARFHTSKGVDVWTKWQLSLLPDTDRKIVSANTNLILVAVGTRLYLIDGTAIRYTADITPDTPTFTALTGISGTAAVGAATDGFHLWTAHGTDGLYQTDTTSGVTAKGVTGNLRGMLAYAKGRLLASDNNVLYNIISVDTGTPAALPAALLTHPNTNWTWVGAAEAPGFILVAGYSGDKSLIYKTAIKADGTALDAPSVAGELPDGEIVRAIQGYLGFVLIGTDKGVRFAAVDSAGNLTIGSLIPTTSSVKCFEPQDRFCWYGLTDYDAVSTGLGRLDLSMVTGPLTPAYASDLMVTGSGAVLSIATFQNLRVFAISGVGVYAQTTTLVATGTLESGQITYRLPDNKTAMFVDVKHDGTGQHAESLSVDGGSFTVIGTHTTSDDPFPAGQRSGARFELRTTLTAVATVGPTIRAVTLRAYPVASTVEMITAPLNLTQTLTLRNKSEVDIDPGFEVDAIKALRASRQLVTWQEGRKSWPVVVDDFEWRPTNQTHDFKGWNGTLVASLKVVQ